MDFRAQAAKAAADGQALLDSYKTKTVGYKGDVDRLTGEVASANKSVSDYTEYMKGEGSAANQYRGEEARQLTQLGYDPAQMTAARSNLNQATGALSAYFDFANSAASKWGMNAGGFAAANAGALSSLNNNISANQGVVSGITDLYKTAQTGANQFTGQVIQGQQQTLSGLQQVFNNSVNQRDNAVSMLQFYEELASKQGGLNAQQQQYYAAAQQAYAASQASMAQASLLAKQTIQAQQQIDQQDAYMKSPAYQSFLNTPTTPSALTANGKKANAAPSILQDNIDFFTQTVPKYGGQAINAGVNAGKKGVDWIKSIF